MRATDGIAPLVSLALLGCAQSLGALVQARAERELACAPPAVVVQPSGELRARAGDGLAALVVFEASGCEREQRYVCAKDTRICEHDFARLPRPDTRAVYEREHELLRKAARARCPGSELRITQESESLFRFDACDGSWLYHCLARGCQRLPAPATATRRL